MRLSEISIRRPVLAAVLTLLLVLFGLLSFTRLPLREYPAFESPIVSVRTVYPGADARLVETDVTTILEDSLSGIASLRTLTSSSREELSTITLEFETSRDLDAAANDVRDHVARVRRQLPATIEDPLVAKEEADGDDIMWLALFSDRHSALELTDVAERYIKSRLSILPGVSTLHVDGERRYAMRIWLDSARLASRRLTVQDVEDALRNQNVTIPSGRIESERMEFSVQTRGDLHTPEQFNGVIVAFRDGYPIRLGEVGAAELGAEDDRKIVRVNGRPAVGLGVVKQSKANTLAVAQAVKTEVPKLLPTLPDGMTLRIAFDSSLAIERSIHEVRKAMGVALVLVVAVVFLFLGNLRATLIPAVAIPASILGAFTLLAVMGYSLNVLTLLGLVLAVGLVVDDAIVVLENIHRRIERGEPVVDAALAGSREIGFAVIATTLSLVAVFVPIVFLSGMIGRLFAELAVAVAGSVLLSGFVALTLTPAMCALWLEQRPSPLGSTLFDRLAARYRRALAVSLRWSRSIGLAGIVIVAASVGLFLLIPGELAPYEDVGWFVGHLVAPEGATLRYTDTYAQQLEGLYAGFPEIAATYTVVARGWRPTIVNRAASWVMLEDWTDRSRSQQDIVAALAPKLAALPGVRAFVINPPPLNQSDNKKPVQFVLGGTSYGQLEEAADRILTEVRESVADPETDLELNKPEVHVALDREKAADLGLTPATIGRTLETLLAGRRVTTFIRDGRAYPVVVKVRDQDRLKPSDIQALYVRGNEGALVPVSSVASLSEQAAPLALHHYNKLRSITISAAPAPGKTLGEALDRLEAAASRVLPPGSQTSLAGESKEFKESTGGLYMTFALALVVIYLLMAAQFDSFLHPLTILPAVPPAALGALAALFVTGGTLNIYSQIGLVMLIGLVTKNAILIVEFANQLRGRGMRVSEAVIEAAALRLRPILMTTSATILGALPLALATGAGAAGRRQIGVVVIGGLIVSTIVTLFLVPAGYIIVARQKKLTSV